MRIGELASAAGVSTRSLRYYEQRGLLSANRQDNGYREYDDSAVDRVHNIRTLLDAGLKTEDIREVNACLDEQDLNTTPTCREAYAVYEQRLRVVQGQLAALTEVENKLKDKLVELGNHQSHRARSTHAW